MKNRCDIIIPIYNAFDCLAPCIDSVLQNTDFNENHLILIDDRSTDERVIPLLEYYAKKQPNKITLLKNSKNLGFVGTVNKGMKKSQNDVLLLNSDTEVTKNWLCKIKTCAYSEDTIATVTPLSNNATLASVPKIFTKNEIPDDLSLSGMSDIVEKCSKHYYPNIPTAHGFCMYIKRKALDKIGYFDEEVFGKGYGEENDFSFRCFKYGYRNVLCDDTYILHKESQSFQSEKVDHSAPLAQKHPTLKLKLDRWCRVRDIKNIGNNIAIAMGCREKRPNILIIIHDWSDIENNVGGTTIHVKDIIKNLRTEYNFHVLAPEGNTYKIHSYFKDTELVTATYQRPIDIAPLGLHSNIYKNMVNGIIEDYGISLVHIHHMVGHYFDIINICKEKKINYLVSLHDFFLDYPEICKKDKKVAGQDNPLIDVKVWREACGKLLNNAKYVIAPSNFTKKEYLKHYQKTNITVIEHGVLLSESNIAKTDANINHDIAFIGAVFPHKGSDFFEKIVNNKMLTGVKIHLFGTTSANIGKTVNFINHGQYQKKDLPSLLSKNHIKAVCIFSLAPETYSYTVTEAIACGVPVISFDIGAAAERIELNNLGWIIKYTNDVKKVASEIQKILNNDEEYKKKIDAISAYRIKTIEEMCNDYKKIYKKEVIKKGLNEGKIIDLANQTSLIEELSCGVDLYFDAYNQIINSKRWRLVSKIKVPEYTKKIIKKLRKTK